MASANKKRVDPDTKTSGLVAKPIARFRSKSLKRRSIVPDGSGAIAAEGSTPMPSP